MSLDTQRAVIALIGPSGSGKSSIGKVLASKLGWAFLDSDREIERQTGRTVADIFQNSGESEFRKLERAILLDIADKGREKLVLATGGGLPVFEDNFALLESVAVVIYLTAPLEVLVTRINHGEERPLLAGADADGKGKDLTLMQQRLGKLIAERESIYNRARYKIDTASSMVEQLADDIMSLPGLVLQLGR